MSLSGWHDAWMHEARGPHGEWTGDKLAAGARYLVPPHSRLVNPRAAKVKGGHADPADHPFFARHPVSAANVVAAFDQASPEEKAQGMRWYSDVHDLAGRMTGGNADEGAGLMAAYSARTPWPVTMINAMRSVDLGRAVTHTDGAIAPEDHSRKAQAVMSGTPPDQAITSPKENAFARLIARGGDDPADPYGQVVVDAHAVSAAAGHRVTEAPPIGPGHDREYEHVADCYRQAAAQISAREGVTVAPYQVQAVTWLHQITADAEAEEAQPGGLTPLQKGQRTATANAWKRWGAVAAQHGLLPLSPGVTVMHGGPGTRLDLSAHSTASATARRTAQATARLHAQEAWRHEPRDAAGRWARIPGEQSYPGEYQEQYLKAWEGEDQPDAKQQLNIGAGSYVGGDYAEAVFRLREASRLSSDPQRRSAYAILAGRIEADHPPDPDSLRSLLQDEADMARDAGITDVQNNLDNAARSMERGGYDGFQQAAGYVDNAADLMAARGPDAGPYPGVADRYRRIARQIRMIPADVIQQGTPRQAATDYAGKAGRALPGLLGGGAEIWDGGVTLFSQEDKPWIAAQMDWSGHMHMSEDVARDVQSAVQHPDRPVSHPSNLTVPLHEMIHGMIGPGQYYRDHTAAYQDPRVASMEEGFTELGTVRHAPEFFRQAGVDKLATKVIAVEGADPVANPVYVKHQAALYNGLRHEAALLRADTGPHPLATWWAAARDVDKAADAVRDGDLAGAGAELQSLARLGDPAGARAYGKLREALKDLAGTSPSAHVTMGELAEQNRDPARVAAGDAWGHYGWQTAAAQAWCQDAAKAEHLGDLRAGTKGYDRVTQLSDEINREGPAGKVGAMARQVIRAAGKDPAQVTAEQLAEVGFIIRDKWPRDPEYATTSPWARAMADVQAADWGVPDYMAGEP